MTRKLSNIEIQLKNETAKRKQAETQLHNALENLNAIFENSPDALMVIDAINGTILKANQMVSNLFGYKLSELKGKNFTILFPPRQELAQHELINELQVYGTVFTQEFRCADGAKRFMDMTSAMVSMDHGLSILASFRDISKRVQMEKRLRESRQKYLQLYQLVRLITDHASDFIWAKDLEQKFLFVNRTMSEKLLNCDNPQDTIGKTEAFFSDWQSVPHSEKSSEKMNNFSDNTIEMPKKSVKYLKEGIIKGKHLILDVHQSPIFNENHQIIGTVGIGRDITKQLKQRKKIRRSNAGASAESLHKGRERILFVDIEEAGAEVASQILEHLGYQTEAGSDPEKALAEFRSNPEHFDLVITDMTLPKMSGETLASEILKIRQDIPIILCTTGYRQPQIDIKSGTVGIAALLIKPLTVSEIAQTVRNVLDQSNLNQ